MNMILTYQGMSAQNLKSIRIQIRKICLKKKLNQNVWNPRSSQPACCKAHLTHLLILKHHQIWWDVPSHLKEQAHKGWSQVQMRKIWPSQCEPDLAKMVQSKAWSVTHFVGPFDHLESSKNHKIWCKYSSHIKKYHPQIWGQSKFGRLRYVQKRKLRNKLPDAAKWVPDRLLISTSHRFFIIFQFLLGFCGFFTQILMPNHGSPSNTIDLTLRTILQPF